MSHSLYMAYSGLRSRALALEVLTNNLANLGTTGFKKQQVSYGNKPEGEVSFSELAKAINQPVVGVRTSTDFSTGSLTPSGNPFDLALNGEGFFVVETPQGFRYTRNGHFTMDSKGKLVSGSGYPVLSDASKPGDPKHIVLPPGLMEVASNGQISVDGIALSRLKLVAFENLDQLVRNGSTLFEARKGIITRPPDRTEVVQGYLEESNLNAVSSIAEVVSLMRSFEMLNQAIRSLSNQVDQRLVNEVGKV